MIKELRRKISIGLYYLIFRRLFPNHPFPLYKLGYRIKYILCKNIFYKIGKNVEIKKNAYFGDGKYIEIGDNSELGINCIVNNDTIIGKNVMMGPDVIIYSNSHETKDINNPMKFQGSTPRKRVYIGDDVWIGARVVILPGVVIGSHSIIGANTVVTKNVPEYAVVVGKAGTVIKDRREIENMVYLK